MAKQKIKKLYIFGYKDIQEKLVTELHKIGVVEIKEPSISNKAQTYEETENRIKEIESLIEDLKFLIRFFESNLDEKTKSDLLKIPVCSPERYRKIINGFKYNLIDRFKRLSKELSQLESKIKELKSQIDELKPWQKIDIRIEQLFNIHPDFKTITAYSPIRDFELIEEKLSHIELLDVIKVNTVEDKIYFILIFPVSEEEKIREILKDVKVTEVDLRNYKGKVKEIIKNSLKEIKEKNKRIEEIKEIIKEESIYLPDAMVCLDHWENILNREIIKRKFFNTERTFLLEGWIPEKDIKKIKGLEERYKEIIIEITDPSPDEEVPVVLDNPPGIKPFEVITKLFGVPGKREIDPTPLFAPFFPIFFGFCLTDAGYGLILTLLAFFYLKKYKPEGDTKLLVKTLIIGGIVTVIIGLLSGGIFGIDIENPPGWLSFIKEAKRFVLFEPLKDSLLVFIIAIACGVIQITFAFLIAGILNLKRKEYYEALGENLSWVIIIIGLVGGLVTSKKIFWYLALGGAGLKIIFSSESKNPIVRLGAGLVKLYGITSVFGDILSYSRLFALALSTSVMALVVNVIIGVVYDMISSLGSGGVVIGIIISVIGLIGAHLVVLALNALGGYVHTMRLQFVEFFLKFYNAGGREFSPFKEEHKYVKVVA